jgi:solute carrier family 29 (equilibrative nucleoside transporter), member 1/2/3
MSGQAAVGVVVSAIQLFSAAASIRAPVSTSIAPSIKEEEAEVKAAFAFFGISTIYMFCSIGAHAWLARTPAYKTMVAPLEQQRKRLRRQNSATTESQGLVSGSSFSPSMEGRERILRVGKANAAFNFALAYVFIVTLVSCFFTFTCYHLIS